MSVGRKVDPSRAREAPPGPSGRVPGVLVLASAAFTKTIGLIITFGGIGVVVNGLVVYIAIQIIGEHMENRELVRRRQDLSRTRS